MVLIGSPQLTIGRLRRHAVETNNCLQEIEMNWFWRIVLSLDAVPSKFRVRAAEALGGSNNPGAVRALLKARASNESYVSEAAIAALKSLGSTALSPLVRLLESTVPAERAHSAEGLGFLCCLCSLWSS